MASSLEQNSPAREAAPEALKKPRYFYDNFVILRLLMALLVLVTHFKVLSNGQLFGQFTMLPDFAVGSFFVVSGYVITASYDKLPLMRSFFAKRFFRMYPLYFLVIILQAIIMTMFFWPDIAPIGGSVVRYLAANLVMLNFLQYDIGGLLSHSPNPGINPALWTLKIEVMFYAVVPLLHWFFLRYRWWGLAGLYIASSIYYEIFHRTGHEEIARQLPGAIRYIVVGMAYYFHRKRIDVTPTMAFFICGVTLLIIGLGRPYLPNALYPLFVGTFTFFFATRLPFRRVKTDLSYGVYMVHGPLIQLALITGLFHDTYAFLAIIIAISCGLAFLSYRFIELPCVTLGHRISKYSAMTAMPEEKAS